MNVEHQSDTEATYFPARNENNEEELVVENCSLHHYNMELHWERVHICTVATFLFISLCSNIILI